MLENVLSPSTTHHLVIPLLAGLCIALGFLLAGSALKTWVHSLVERLVLYGLLGVVAVSWVGAILAGLGVFCWWLLLAALLVLAALVRLAPWISRRLDRPLDDAGAAQEEVPPGLGAAPPPATPWYGQVALALLLLATAYLYARPAETFLLVDDASVYTIGSTVLASEGTLDYARQVVYDRDLYGTPAKDLVRLFYTAESSDGLLATAFRGPFYTMPNLSSRMEIGFLPLPKVWGAILVWLFGARYAVWAAVLFGVLGVAVVYGIARLALGWAPSLLAAALLACSLPQIWFSRYALSEIPTQVFLLGGLYMLGLAWQAGPKARTLALWGAASLAAITMLRLEALFVLGLLVGLWLLAERGDRRAALPWLAVLLVGAVAGTALSALAAPSYLYTRLILIFTRPVSRLAILGLVAVALGLAIWAGQPVSSRRAWLDFLGRTGIGVLRWGLFVGVGLAGIWCAWVLANGADHDIIASWLGQYLGVLIVLFGLGGIILSLWPLYSFRGQKVLVLSCGIAALFFAVYMVDPQVRAAHPWAMRRLVPAVIPGLMLGVAVAVDRIVSWIWRRAGTWPVAGLARGGLAVMAAALVVVQVGGVARVSYPFWAHREYGGMWDQLQALDDDLPQGALVLLVDSDAAGVGKRLAPALELVWGHPTYSIPDRTLLADELQMLQNLVTSAWAQDRAVYLVDVGGHLCPYVDSWQLEAVERDSVSVPRVRPGVTTCPVATDVETYRFDLDLYRLSAAEAATAWSTIHVSPAMGSLLYLRSGFSDQDVAPTQEPYRWTLGDARLVLPWPAGYESIDLDLALDWSDWRPEGTPPAEFAVYVEGQLAGELPAGKTWGRRTMKMAVEDVEDIGAPGIEITLVSDLWDTEGGSQLGVSFYGMDVDLVGGSVSSTIQP